MTTNKPRVRGWIFDWSFRGTGGVRIHFSEPLDSPGIVIGTKEPLVSLSDYEALQAECGRLRAIISDLKDWDCDVNGGFLSIPVDLRRRMQESIDAAMQEQIE